MTEDAAADWINQAEALSDGERIYVPTQEEAEESAQSVSGQWADPNGNAGGSVSDKININTAAKEELMTLSGIGASKAESILEVQAGAWKLSEYRGSQEDRGNQGWRI